MKFKLLSKYIKLKNTLEVLFLVGLFSANLSALPLPEIYNLDLKGLSQENISQINLAKQKIISFSETGSKEELAELFGQIGMLFHTIQQLEVAKSSYLSAVDLNSKEPRWLYLLGMVFQQDGNAEEAYNIFRRSFELQPDYLPTLVHLGNASLQKDDSAQAKRIFSQLYLQDGYKAISAEALGRIALKDGQLIEAINYFKEVLNLQPQADRVYYFLAQAYRKAGKKDEAKQALTKRGERFPHFSDPLMAYVKSLNISVHQMLTQGYSFLKAKNYSKAVELFDKGLQIEPDNVNLLTAKGLANEYLGNDKAALALYKKALSLKPTDTTALFNLAVLEEILQNPKRAAELYTKLLTVQKDHIDALAMFSDLQFREGNFEAASKTFASLQLVTPSNSQVMLYRGVSLLATGNCPWGRNILSEALNLDPANGNIALILSVTLAQCSDEAGLKRARELVNQVYASQPSFQSARFTAYILAYIGKFEDAIDLQTQAMFEALKNGGLAQYPDLAVNMKRYRAGKKPDWNWQAYAYEIAKSAPTRKGK